MVAANFRDVAFKIQIYTFVFEGSEFSDAIIRKTKSGFKIK